MTSLSRQGLAVRSGARANRYLRMASRLQHNQVVMRPALVLLGLLTTLAGGCLYIDTINEPPTVRIRWTDQAVYRGTRIMLEAEIVDPDDDAGTAMWRFWPCDTTEWASCGSSTADDPGYHGIYLHDYLVPELTDEGAQVKHVLVELTARDSRRAMARLTDSRTIHIANSDPEPQVATAKWRDRVASFPVDVPIAIALPLADDDDPANELTITTSVTRNTVAVAQPPLTDEERSMDGTLASYVFRPTEAGSWVIVFHVADRGGGKRDITLPLTITPDEHPCLASLVPVFEGPLLVDEPRRFTVRSVDDDKDPYPSAVSDPLLPGEEVMGVAHFQWSLSSPSDRSVFVPLTGQDGPDLLIDPALYVPGDTFDVRVDALDRIDRKPCDPSNRTCSQRDDVCSRRRTWTVEIR